MGNKSPRLTTTKEYGAIQAVFYGFDMARMLKGLLAELVFGNIGVGVSTYVRRDNLKILRQVGSPKSVSAEKRLNGFSESNRGELGNNPWLNLWYIQKELNIGGDLTKDTSPQILRRLLNGNISHERVAKSRRKEKDLNIATNPEAVAADGSQWQMRKAIMPSLNSGKLHVGNNSEILKQRYKTKNF